MDNNDDPFDLERFKVSEEEARVLSGIAATKVERRRQQFTKVPNSWVEELRKARNISTYRVALYLLYRHWKGRRRPIPLSNVALFSTGVTRRGKWKALAELERLGLVEVARRSKRAPLITVCDPNNAPNMRPSGASGWHRQGS
jgi:hypothetical protein